MLAARLAGRISIPGQQQWYSKLVSSEKRISLVGYNFSGVLNSFPSFRRNFTRALSRKSQYGDDNASETTQGAVYSAKLECDENIVDSMVESLINFGAKSCTIEDAYAGTNQEEEIYSSGPVPWDSGPRQLWKKNSITALFSTEEEILPAINFASESLELQSLPKYTITEVADRNWVELVQKLYHPIPITESLWILPHWLDIPPTSAPGSMFVRLDPGLAFGTGEHPTTRLCLRVLQNSVQKGDRVMDYGCGSGVLGITALLMGASHSTFVDIDPLALRSTNHNAALNGISPDSVALFTVDSEGAQAEFESFPSREKYDLVVANILVGPLVSLAGKICEFCREGGVVGLSGILTGQVEEVRSAYSSVLENFEVSEEDGWAAIKATKKKTSL